MAPEPTRSATAGPASPTFADGVDQRFTATTEFLADVARWMQHSRDELAIEMAACLGSREAMAIKVDLDHRTAAADLAERILAAAASCLDAGLAICGLDGPTGSARCRGESRPAPASSR